MSARGRLEPKTRSWSRGGKTPSSRPRRTSAGGREGSAAFHRSSKSACSAGESWLQPEAAAFSSTGSAACRRRRDSASGPAGGSSRCASASRARNSLRSSRCRMLALVPVPKAPARFDSRSDRCSSLSSRWILSCNSLISADAGWSSRASEAALHASRQFSRPACACAARK
eukprot:scaffold74020_cov27-Tisochrysis_lutea.AAC.3